MNPNDLIKYHSLLCAASMATHEVRPFLSKQLKAEADELYHQLCVYEATMTATKENNNDRE